MLSPIIFKRKIYNKLLQWKENSQGLLSTSADKKY